MYLRSIGRHFTQMNAYSLVMNSKSTRTHGSTCLSLKGKIIRRKSHAQSIFIWEARLALRQIINQIELTNRFSEVLDF